MDCCVQSLLEADACASLHGLVEALKRSLVIVWAKMPQKTLRKVAEGFRSKLKLIKNSDRFAPKFYNSFKKLDNNKSGLLSLRKVNDLAKKNLIITS